MKTNRVLFTSFLLLLFSNFLHLSAANSDDYEDTEFIRTWCNKTYNSYRCFITLSKYATTVNRNLFKLAQQSVSNAITDAITTTKYISNLPNKHEAQDCIEAMNEAMDKVNNSLDDLRKRIKLTSNSFSSNINNKVSALDFEDTCQYAGRPMEINEAIDRLRNVKVLTAIASELVIYFEKE
ncbi:hypothetical protein ACFE04_030753 [Oxalis oulophora]